MGRVFTRHEAGLIEIEDRVYDVGYLSHAAKRMLGVELVGRRDASAPS
jgi:hypothetical protein